MTSTPSQSQTAHAPFPLGTFSRPGAAPAYLRRPPLYHYPPGAACVMCAVPAAAHVVQVRGGCVPVCADCVAAGLLTPVPAYVSTHPSESRGLVIDGPVPNQIVLDEVEAAAS